MDSNELYHHGIKGQKWGVRKAKEISTNIHRRSMGLPGNKDEAIRNTGMNPAKRIATAAVGAHARSQGLSTKPLQEKSPYSVRAQRKDAKRRQYYLKDTEANSKWWKSEVDRNIKSRNKMKKMSDKELFDNIDDDELIVKGMGMDKKSYRDLLLKEANYEIKRSRDAAKAWTDAHDEIMNAPLGKYTKRKDYREVINRHLNANNNLYEFEEV